MAPWAQCALSDENGLLAFVDDLAAPVETVTRDVVPKVRLPRGRLNGQRGLGQAIVRATHASPGSGLSVLLNSHDSISRIGLVFGPVL